MNYNSEYCDPFSEDPSNIWMKLEHAGRYLFARDLLVKANCKTVIDVASATGYGSKILANAGLKVLAVDKNKTYLSSIHMCDVNIRAMCINLDSPEIITKFPTTDAVVCFETLEHLCFPYAFLEKITSKIRQGGLIVLSFPNIAFEQFNEDGSNKDPYHLQTIDDYDIWLALKKYGFQNIQIYGQPLCNTLCTAQHDLDDKKILSADSVDKAFRYDERSILTLSRLLAYPIDNHVENSYSFIIVAQKA